MGFPYMSYKLTQLLFLIGLLLATLNIFLIAVGLPPAVTKLFIFIGLFLTGWALISFAVSKNIISNQRFIAMLFAVIILTGVFGLKIAFTFGIAGYA
jgi:hypothetical protein